MQLGLPLKSDDVSGYRLLWNAPWPTQCAKRGFAAKPAVDWGALGITTNRGAAFNGESVATFYSDQGLYPYFTPSGLAVNGGIPQATNLTAHLSKWRQDIEATLPDPSSAGVAVVDWESWSPLMVFTSAAPPSEQLYIEASVKRVREEHPALTNTTEIYAMAQRAFESAGVTLMRETIRAAKALRPRTRWGFYGYPHCHTKDCKAGVCTRSSNDKLGWLWDEVTSLHPSVYLLQQPDSANTAYVSCQLSETQRVANLSMERVPGRAPPQAFPFASWSGNHQTSHGWPYLDSTEAFDAEFVLPRRFGAAGAIIWGSSNAAVNASRCEGAQSAGLWLNAHGAALRNATAPKPGAPL